MVKRFLPSNYVGSRIAGFSRSSTSTPNASPTTVKSLSFRWATVVQTTPLRIIFDGETVALPVTPDTLNPDLAIGQRVWVQLYGNSLIILGGGAGGGGGGPTPPPTPTPFAMPWEDVMDHGAVGDGVTDDTSAIEAALAAAGSDGAVFFPNNKTFRVTHTIHVTTQELIGFTPNQNNPGSTRAATIKYTGTGDCLWLDSANVRGIRFIGLGKSVAGVSALYLDGAAKVRDCAIFDFANALRLDQCWYAVVESVFVRYCDIAANINYSYNVSLSDLRVSCAGRTSGDYGQGIVMTDRSMVTMHGGSIEQYSIGVQLNGGNQSFTAYSLYEESYYSGAIGVQFYTGKSVATLIGSEVYLDNHHSWIHAGAGLAAGSTVTGIGNKFKASANDPTPTTYAYFIGGTTALNTSGDDWGGVGSATGYAYRNLALGGPGVVCDPVGTTTPGGLDGGGVAIGGAGPLVMENNRGIILPSGGLPASADGPEVRIDPATGKLKFWWGGSWHTVTSS